jgi:hypothetical protein
MIDSTHGFWGTAFHFRAKIIHQKQTPGSAGRPAPEGACFDEASENQVVSGL